MPVVVSMGNVAASGGYWVATPAISSSPSRRPSPDRSACSACCRASRAAGQARARRRRHQDHAAVGRARPAEGPIARSRRADPGRGRTDLPPVPRHRRARRAARPRRKSTGSPRAACGTAAPRANWAGRRVRRDGRSDRQGGRAGQARRRARRDLPRAAPEASRTDCSRCSPAKMRPRARPPMPSRRCRRRPKRCWLARSPTCARSCGPSDPGALPRMPAGRAGAGCRGEDRQWLRLVGWLESVA